MVFWRKKKNASEQEQAEKEDKIVHPDGAPEIEPSTDADSELPRYVQHDFEETETDIIEELEATPTPKHTPEQDLKEARELSDHSDEGGWLSRLSSGLSKSTNKITGGISDVLTKKKLDQDALDSLEEVLISADLGPRTAAKVMEEFSKDRFGKDISEDEIKEALAEAITNILEPVAKPLTIEKPAEGPFVILMAGVNGVGKTTTIGKLAEKFTRNDGLKVMMAAGDTFRAAATEQLQIWANRVGCKLIAKDVGADAAAVAYEAYTQAKAENIDVLLIDTAGRLQNKANLMEELAKIIRVLKKNDETIPHSTLLVLDATTGQNAFSQLETFKEMVNVSGLIVTKLDGSAKGGVFVGLADQFGTPVHAIGVGEGIEDMQPFNAREYARSLMGIE
ncbi:MAG: signal recognition particle-docking protein FtsY [Alphaproteobacteria bacterium]|nr:signal recognition particle-docking protein FtsY [Alphaproteobacteria bacterium]